MKSKIKTNRELLVQLREMLLGDDFLYESFVASAYSALRECPDDLELMAVARIVIDRIIGRE